MATVTVSTPIDTSEYFSYFVMLNVDSILSESPTLISLEGPGGQNLRITGSGFTYDEDGIPLTGTATGFSERIEGSTTVSITGMSITVVQFEEFLTLEGLDVAGLVEFALRSADTITGSSGDDGLSAFGGHDTLNGGAGDDTLDGGIGNDVLNGGNGNDLLTGANGADELKGNAGDDELDGGALNDLLDGGTGADTMTGGTGADTFLVDNELDSVIEYGRGGTDVVRSTVTHYLNANVERLILLGTQNLNGTGNEEDNFLTGNAGNNVLNGGIGNDTLTGKGGNDSYYVDTTLDVVVEAAAEGVDTVYNSYETFTLPANVERLTLTGEASEGIGNILNNILNGTETGASTLRGEGGNDTVNGYAGDDILRGGAGNDTMSGGAGNDELHGDAGVDSMTGGPGNDEYWLNDANDVATEAAEGGYDTIYANITIHLGNFANFEKIILTGSANVNGTGNAEANQISGNSGNNILNAGAGGDSIFGGAGNDTIYGKGGFDTMEGGAGNDRFIFDTAIGGEENNSVIDFATGEDKIVLDKTIFTVLTVGTLNADAFVSGAGMSTASDAEDRIIYDTGTGNLYYDADGTGGSFAPIQFANISGGPDVSASDISVVA